jgi:hypothetical protein
MVMFAGVVCWCCLLLVCYLFAACLLLGLSLLLSYITVESGRATMCWNVFFCFFMLLWKGCPFARPHTHACYPTLTLVIPHSRLLSNTHACYPTLTLVIQHLRLSINTYACYPTLTLQVSAPSGHGRFGQFVAGRGGHQTTVGFFVRTQLRHQ